MNPVGLVLRIEFYFRCGQSDGVRLPISSSFAKLMGCTLWTEDVFFGCYSTLCRWNRTDIIHFQMRFFFGKYTHPNTLLTDN